MVYLFIFLIVSRHGKNYTLLRKNNSQQKYKIEKMSEYLSPIEKYRLETRLGGEWEILSYLIKVKDFIFPSLKQPGTMAGDQMG